MLGRVGALQGLDVRPAPLSQDLLEIATENSSTVVFPVPIDVLKPFYEMATSSGKDDGEDDS